jgi:hypothetical protein
MMKKSLLGVMLAVLLFGLSSRVFATTTDALQITSGSFTAIITDNGTCSGTACVSLSGDINPTAGTDSITGSINGWALNIISGSSNSPDLIPFGIDITSLTATCAPSKPCSAAPLHVIYSDTGFNVPVLAGGFLTTYSNTQSGSGSTDESAYFANTNTLFNEASSIGTVGPFTGSNTDSANGGTMAAGPTYSLTLDQIFKANGSAVSFSADGDITAVPEPGSIALVGTGLIGLAGLLRRRLLRA